MKSGTISSSTPASRYSRTISLTSSTLPMIEGRSIGRLRSFYQADPLRKKLNSVFGERKLGAEDLRSLLLIVTRNATTDSPWPVCNNE